MNLIREVTGRIGYDEEEDGAERRIVREFLRSAIVKRETKFHKKRIVTVETLNRYIFALNTIYVEKVVTALDLKLKIRKELEGRLGWEIDKKTVLKMLAVLEQEGLLAMKEFPLQTQKADGEIFTFRRTFAIPAYLSFNSPEVKRHRVLCHPHFKSELTLDRIHAARSLRAIRNQTPAGHPAPLSRAAIPRRLWNMKKLFLLKILEKAYER